MSILGQLEHDLIAAARLRQAEAAARVEHDRAGFCEGGDGKADRREFGANGAQWALGARLRRLRVPAIALGALLASGTIALAASDLILTGSPVAPSNQQNSDVGNGVPAAGASVLLPLRVSDPEGGLPWGMRVIHTTRGKLCLQVGRVKDGELGELGVDGAFNDDRRFHPLPPSALPSLAPDGQQPAGDANTSCNLIGEAIVAQNIGLDRSAAELRSSSPVAIGHRRDVYFGVLGPDAVSVSYRAGKGRHTEAVMPGSGIYLIVKPMTSGEQVGTGSTAIGTYGNSVPSAPLTAITYRIDGKSCERGPVHPPWSKAPSIDTCPQMQLPSAPAQQRQQHEPLHIEVQAHKKLLTGLDVSFTAPYAINDASWEYAIRAPYCQTADSRGAVSQSLERDVAKGETVRLHLGDPFVETCGRDAKPVERRTVTIEAVYQHADGGGSIVVGSATVTEPPGTRPAPVHRPAQSAR
ncbi:MAG: hypothetical protein ACTHM1_04285 [Solirubrobacteraceae bacterium]